MALQTSGAISLNDIHVEAGGSSGTNCTINDSDIRGLINKASGATMSFNEWYGASAVWDTSITLQRRTTSDEYGNATTEVIYKRISPSYGSIGDTTFPHSYYTTAYVDVVQIDWGTHSSGATPSSCTIRFYYGGGGHYNGGFSKIELVSSGRNFSLNRTSASYSTAGSFQNQYVWTGQSITYASSNVSGTFKIYP